MAQNKKSFIAYCDWLETFEELEDAEAGRLVKHLFRYVNDLDPQTEDKLTKMMFIPIKQTLKRDLAKHEAVAERNKVNGQKGGRPKKPNGLSGLKEKPKKADSDSDIDSVTVNDNDINNKNKETATPKFNFRKSLIDLGVEEQVAKDWLKVRKAKKAVNSKTSFNRIKKQIYNSGREPNECISLAAAKDWKGFEAEWINNLTKKDNDGLTKNEKRIKQLREEEF